MTAYISARLSKPWHTWIGNILEYRNWWWWWWCYVFFAHILVPVLSINDIVHFEMVWVVRARVFHIFWSSSLCVYCISWKGCRANSTREVAWSCLWVMPGRSSSCSRQVKRRRCPTCTGFHDSCPYMDLWDACDNPETIWIHDDDLDDDTSRWSSLPMVPSPSNLSCVSCVNLSTRQRPRQRRRSRMKTRRGSTSNKHWHRGKKILNDCMVARRLEWTCLKMHRQRHGFKRLGPCANDETISRWREARYDDALDSAFVSNMIYISRDDSGRKYEGAKVGSTFEKDTCVSVVVGCRLVLFWRPRC